MSNAMSSTPWAGRRFHFIGVGGAGMSGLALVARALGAGGPITPERGAELLLERAAAGER